MMVLWRSAIARAILTAALAAVFISGELLWTVERSHSSSSGGIVWNGVEPALGAGTPVGECQFFSSAQASLTSSGPYPCRMDASRGTYVFLDNASIAATQSGTWTVTQSGSWTVTSLAPFGNSDAQSGVANSLWGEALYNGSTYDRAREGSVLGSQLVTVGGTLPAFASTPAFSISGTLPAFASTPTVNIGAALPAGSNTIGNVNAIQPFPGNNDGQTGTSAGQAVGLDIWNGASWDRMQGTGGAPNVAVPGGVTLNAGSALVGGVDIIPAAASAPTLTQLDFTAGATSGCQTAAVYPATPATSSLNECYKVDTNAGILLDVEWNSLSSIVTLTAGATITCYDNTTNSGRVVWQGQPAAGEYRSWFPYGRPYTHLTCAASASVAGSGGLNVLELETHN